MILIDVKSIRFKEQNKYRLVGLKPNRESRFFFLVLKFLNSPGIGEKIIVEIKMK